MLQRGLRMATALLLLVVVSPGMPVLCFSAAHAGLETPFAPCCGGHPAPLRASMEGCGDCDDVPLASVIGDGLSGSADHLKPGPLAGFPVCGLLQPATIALTPSRGSDPALLPPAAQPSPLLC
jgi:hypothetical protein